MLEMPQDVASDAYMAEIWSKLTTLQEFREVDIPNLSLLCFWHAVARAAERAMTRGKSIKVLDQVGYKEIKAANGRRAYLEKPHPAISVLKQATSEIRALNDTLGISKKTAAAVTQPAPQVSTNSKLLTIMFDERAARAKKAAGK